MNEFEKRILTIISEQPGIRGAEIAQIIGCERKDIISVLFGSLKMECYQDPSYRWFLRSNQKSTPPSDSFSISNDKSLADICKYYLNCLSLEENNGISTFLNSSSPLDYAELHSVTIDSSNDNVARLIQKVASGRNLIANVG